MKTRNFLSFLKEKNQSLLIDYLTSLSEDLRETLIDQFSQSFKEDYFLSSKPEEKIYEETQITPLSSCSITSNPSSSNTLSSSLHIVILAAGQGTRLGFTKPKALLPVHDTSLIGLHLSQLSSLKKDPHVFIHLLLSKEQGGLIKDHLEKKKYFGFSPLNIFFHYQKDAFFIDEQGLLYLASPNTLAKGPAGNGEVFHSIASDKIKNQDLVFILPVDNPLGMHSLPHLLHAMEKKERDLTLCIFPKTSPEESLGIVVEYSQKPHIIDYPFIPSSLKNSDSSLWANTNLFALRGSFFHFLAQQALPFHTVMKPVDVYDNQTILKKPLYRFERFITDILPFASNPHFLSLPQENIYCAIKDPITYKQALIQINH